ncbi:MAG: MurR/RpiR family transcriptional regulator [Clostridiales bacterium]|nr:MurR/RpiR family transcriptional regulator [Clostridiales bacterium]
MYIDYLTDSITRLIQIVNDNNNSVNETERNIAIQMIKHLNQIPNCSISQVADFCYCSIATISRFVKKLNFENFSTFRYKLALDLFNSPKLNLKMPGEYQIDYAHLKSRYLEEIKNQIDELEKGIAPEEIERAVKLLYEAETVLFYSHGDLDFHGFQVDLVMHGKVSWHVKGYSEMEKALDTLNEKTVVVAPLFSTQNGRQNVEMLHARGIKMIIVARGNVNIYEKYADAFFRVKMSETKMDDYLIHLLFDILSMHYRKKYLD